MTKHIYFVDDEESLRDIFLEFFNSEEYQVTVFHEGAPAIAACQELRPDIIFIDYRLPDTNGEQLARELDDGIIKVLMTGELNFEVSYPFEKVIIKPYRLSEVGNLIEQFLKEE